MIGWEKTLKIGKGLDLSIDFKGKNILESNEIGYARRIFFRDKVLFFSSSSGFSENYYLNEGKKDFQLPNTIGHFEPEISDIFDLKYLEEILGNFKKEISIHYKRFEILKQSISFSKFYWELKNSSEAEVSLRNYSINGFILVEKEKQVLKIPFLSNLDLTLSFSDYLNILQPYLYLPLQKIEIKPSRLPVLLHPFTLSFIFENFKKYFLSGEIPEMAEGFKIKDLPFHPKSPNYFPVDGEGALKRIFRVKKNNIPMDSHKAYLRNKSSTSNSFRNSIFLPPEVGFHNIVLEGPEKSLDGIENYLYLTIPREMENYPPFFILEAEGFLIKKGVPVSFFPSLYAKFTLKDFFSSFSFVKKPLLFYSFSFSYGVPFLFLKGLSIYPIL